MGRKLNAKLVEIGYRGGQRYETDSPDRHLKTLWLTGWDRPDRTPEVGATGVMEYRTEPDYGLWFFTEGAEAVVARSVAQ